MPTVAATRRRPELAAPLAGGRAPLFATYSLILATFLGTMGLPHVLVRFYTNPDGRGRPAHHAGRAGPARRASTCCPPCYGVLGRLYAPQLLVTGQHRRRGAAAARRGARRGWPASCSAAWSPPARSPRSCPPSSGLLVSVAGVLSTDVLRGAARCATSGWPRCWPAWCRCVAGADVTRLDLSQVVGLAFAVAASTFCPLLVLGIWWRGLTDARRGRRAAGRAAALGRGGAGQPCSRPSPSTAGRRCWSPAGRVDRAARVRCRWCWSAALTAVRVPADVDDDAAAPARPRTPRPHRDADRSSRRSWPVAPGGRVRPFA